MSKKITREANTLYCMCVLLKIANNYNEYLQSAGIMVREAKQVSSAMGSFHRKYMNTITADLRPEIREQWLAEFSDRDIEVYSSILFKLNNMTEQQRAIAEELVTQFADGRLAVHDGTITDIDFETGNG